MAYWLDSNNSYVPTGQKSYYCDDTDDISDLPTNLTEGKPMGDTITHRKCEPGSFCLCIADSSGWILNSEGEWKEV